MIMATFAKFCAGYFSRYFELHPAEAIYYGIEGHDHLLNDYSDETYEAERSFVIDSLAALRSIDAGDLDDDQKIDYALLEGKLTIQNYEHAKEDYRLKWPDIYSPIDAIYILTVRATSDFARNLLSRLNAAPAVLRQGIENLGRKEANPPKLWTEMALDGAKGAVSFLENLPSHPKVQGGAIDAGTLHAAIDNAKTAVREFASFLENNLAARSNGVYAVGTEHYNLLLRHKHFLVHDAASLLRFGEELFDSTKRELTESRQGLVIRGRFRCGGNSGTFSPHADELPDSNGH